MPSIASGANATGTFGYQDSVTIQAAEGYARFESPTGTIISEFAGSRTFGPYNNQTYKITSLKGALYYEVADGTNAGALIADATGIVTAGGGAPVSPSATTGIAATAGGQFGQLAGVLIDGDSLGGLNWNELSVTALTRSGTTASVTATSFAPQVGGRIRIGNVTSDTRWNGFFTVTGVVNVSTAQFTVDASLDPNPTTTRSQITVAPDFQRTASAEYVWAEMLNGTNYTLVDNVAVGGRVTTEILADFYSIGPGRYRNCLIDLNAATNDVRTAVATATTSAAYEQYIQAAVSCGHKVLCQTVPPLGSPADTASTRQAMLAINQEIRRLALKYSMPLYDKFAALVDPASSTATVLTANIDTADGIHLSPTGAKICGNAKATIFARYVQSRPFGFPAAVGDTSGSVSTSSNIIDGFFAGTGGSGGAGSVATGWTLAPTTITVTGSKGSGSVGSTQILTLSGSSGSFTFTGTSVHSQVVAGGVYELIGKISLANFAAGLRVVVEIANTINGFTGSVRALGTRSATSALPTANGTIQFRSDPFTVPSGATVTSFTPKLTCVTTGAPGGTETVTLENWALRRIA